MNADTISMITGLCLLMPADALAQSGAVRIAVVDSVSMAPVERAAVLLDRLTLDGDGPAVPVRYTDSLGTITVHSLQAGQYETVVSCPPSVSWAPLLARFSMTIQKDHVQTVRVLVASDVCEQETFRKQGRFHGVYHKGFEQSAFLPCTLDRAIVLADWRIHMRHAWVSFTSGAWGRVPASWRGLGETQTATTWYVDWWGTLRGPGNYGHLGASAFDFVVDSIVTVSENVPADCPIP